MVNQGFYCTQRRQAGWDVSVWILVIKDDVATADYIACGLAQEGQTA